MLQEYVIVMFLISCYACHHPKPLVSTPLGKIQGYIKTSHDGRKFSAFQGIPYAKPPIGDRRFEEPEPQQPWIGTWNATSSTECVQYSAIKMIQTGILVVEGNEDCLHLNVYVPGENPDPQSNLDVVVHIHGGGYMIGSGHMYSHPEFLMDKDLIFVTFNYRLGIFGFLSTEDEVVPGNNGLKDQAMALRWVKDNIASFGGNPDSVTINGLSAGGSSVHLHYFSQLSKGLFHRGHSQSGVALNHWSMQEAALSKAKLLSNAVGCPTDSSYIMVKCLKQRPFGQLHETLRLFQGYKLFPFCPFGPVVEKAGSNPFLSEHPYKMLMERRVHDVPWIASMAAHEGATFLDMIKDGLEEVGKHWNDYAPILLDFNYTLPQELWKSTSEKIKDFYLGKDQTISFGNFSKLAQIFSDRVFLVDAEDAVRLQAEATRSPVYYYHFNYPGDNNEDKIVPHGADGKYYYHGNFMSPQPLTTDELKMKNVFMDMLVSYAKTGIPTFEGTDWKPTRSDEFTYLNISGYAAEDMKLHTVDELTPRKFWKSLGLEENENLIRVRDEL